MGNFTKVGEWSLFLLCPKNDYLCLIMPAKFFLFWFQPLLVLSRICSRHKTFFIHKPCLVNKIMCFPVFIICFHLCCFFNVNNTLSITFTHKITTPRILWRVSLFFKNYAWSHMFTMFFGNSKFSIKTKTILVFVQNKRVLEIQVIL
jgi:hypothetical protein